MAWRQQDILLRQIEQISAAIRRAFGMKDSSPADAVEVLRNAAGQLLGPAGQFVRQVDAQTSINIIGDPRRLALWARLLAAESEIVRGSGDDSDAASLRERARVIARAAADRDEGAREQVADLLATLEEPAAE